MSSESAQWVSINSDSRSFEQHLRNLEPALQHFNCSNGSGNGLQSSQHLSNDSLVKWWEAATVHFKLAANKAQVAEQLQALVSENALHLVMPLQLQKMMKNTASTASIGMFGKAADKPCEEANENEQAARLRI